MSEETNIETVEEPTDIEGGIKKVLKPSDPNRCQHVIPSQGQCYNIGVLPGANCLAHGGGSTLKADERHRKNAYRLFIFEQRLKEHIDYPDIKGLRDEIALMRMLVEEKLNLCGDLFDLNLVSSSVSDLIMKVNMLVMNCQKLESSLGKHVDATALLVFAKNVVDIISRKFDQPEDEERVREVADELLKSLGTLDESS